MDSYVTPPPLPGDRVGEYTLIEVLGVGGNATVYRASSEARPIIALKILHPGKIDTDENRRFRREFLTLQKLRHPGVVVVYEFGQHGDYPWIAMEYVEGIDLDSCIDRWRAAPSPDRFEAVELIFHNLCEALAYVHERGLIHRDLKPSNVLLTADGIPKLSDFGVVKAAGSVDTHLTMAGRLVGTVAFMAPEQIMGDPMDSRADLYSLGAVLYLMLTLIRPIEADSIAGYLARHLTHVPRAPAEIDPRVPRHLERICVRLLLKDPAQRYSSARQVLEVLAEGLPASRPPVHGRDPLLSGLLVRLDALQDGTGGVVILSGNRGSGKSTFLVELAERARSAGNDLVQCSGSDPDPLDRLAEQLPALYEQNDPLSRIVYSVKIRPLTLVIDDLDQLPEEALRQLSAMMRDLIAVDGERLLVIGAITQEEGARGEGYLLSLMRGSTTGLTPERIVLDGLDRRATIALVRDRGVGGAAGAALGHRLFEELHGHPGAILDQITALVAAGWMVSTMEGDLRATRSIDELREAPLPVSDRIRDTTTVRLSLLPLAARAILEVLVVLNMEGTAALMGRLTELDPGTVSQGVGVLLEEGMVTSRMEGATEVLSLAEDQNRNQLYATIEPEHRASLHIRIARTLRRRSRRRLGPMAGIIARHLMQGGQVAEAWPLLLIAAQRKMRSGKVIAARRLLRLAMDARPAAEKGLSGDELSRNLRLLYTLEGETLERAGDLTGAVKAWESALVAAEDEGDQQTIARIRSGLGLAFNAQGDIGAATAGLEQAITALQRGDPMWPRVARALASARLESGQIDGAEGLWRDLLELSRATDSASLRAEAVAGLGMISLARGQLTEGRKRLEGAQVLLHGHGTDLEQARRLLLLSELDHAAGRLLESRRRAREAEGLAREVPRVLTCVRCLGMAAWASWAMGEDGEAARLVRSGASLLDARGLKGSAEELRAQLPLARTWALLGNLDRARAVLPADLNLDERGLDDPDGQRRALLARLTVSQGAAQARAMARDALSRTPAALPWAAARIELDAAHALSTLGDRAEAIVALRRAEARLVSGELSLLALEAARLGRALGLGGEYGTRVEHLNAVLEAELSEQSSPSSRWG
ncbi:MAG: serine/threonine protein kinase/tetratricopeptide (TPR) repeat protein [Myxococcota bacterium]|jgi:serine/threonine protein kinase/tetratricopeptide (TPR) repeat protein